MVRRMLTERAALRPARLAAPRAVIPLHELEAGPGAEEGGVQPTAILLLTRGPATLIGEDLREPSGERPPGVGLHALSLH